MRGIRRGSAVERKAGDGSSALRGTERAEGKTGTSEVVDDRDQISEKYELVKLEL